MITRTRQLVLMRHVKSDWDLGATNDFERGIRQNRKGDAIAAAAFLSGKGFTPELILASPALRTMQTTMLMLPQWNYPLNRVRTEMDLYESGYRRYLETLVHVPDQITSLLLVGHNPSLTDLFASLDEHLVEQMSTASCALFEIESKSWDLNEVQSCKLLHFWRPSKDRD